MVGVASRWLRGLSANDGGEEWAEVGEPGVCLPAHSQHSALFTVQERKRTVGTETHT
jgi:hypothetical protein